LDGLSDNSNNKTELPISDLPADNALVALLRRNGIFTIGDLLNRTDEDLLKIQGFGAKKLYDTHNAIAELTLDSSSVVSKETRATLAEGIDSSWGRKLSEAQIHVLSNNRVAPISELSIKQSLIEFLSLYGVTTIGKLMREPFSRLTSLRDFGAKKLNELVDALEEFANNPENDNVLTEDALQQKRYLSNLDNEFAYRDFLDTSEIAWTRYKPLRVPLSQRGDYIINIDRPIVNLPLHEMVPSSAKLLIQDASIVTNEDVVSFVKQSVHEQQEMQTESYIDTDSLLFLLETPLDRLIEGFDGQESLDDFVKNLNKLLFPNYDCFNLLSKAEELKHRLPPTLLYVRLIWFSQIAPWFTDEKLTVYAALNQQEPSFCVLHFIEEIIQARILLRYSLVDMVSMGCQSGLLKKLEQVSALRVSALGRLRQKHTRLSSSPSRRECCCGGCLLQVFL
jgi:hypothetical protein